MLRASARALAIVFVGAALAGGCTGTSFPPVAKTSDLPVTSHLPVSSPRCASSQLSGSETASDGAAGTAFVTIAVRNVSSSTCLLRGSPKVEMLGASGTPLPVREHAGLSGAPTSHPTTVALHPRERARLVVAFIDVNIRELRCLDARTLRIRPLRARGALQVPLGSGSVVCNRTIWVSPFAGLP
jgi:Protein of unknown function (DUF4232)